MATLARQSGAHGFVSLPRTRYGYRRFAYAFLPRSEALSALIRPFSTYFRPKGERNKPERHIAFLSQR